MICLARDEGTPTGIVVSIKPANPMKGYESKTMMIEKRIEPFLSYALLCTRVTIVQNWFNVPSNIAGFYGSHST